MFFPFMVSPRPTPLLKLFFSDIYRPLCPMKEHLRTSDKFGHQAKLPEAEPSKKISFFVLPFIYASSCPITPSSHSRIRGLYQIWLLLYDTVPSYQNKKHHITTLQNDHPSEYVTTVNVNKNWPTSRYSQP